MRTKKILLIGAGGHAESCIDVIESGKNYRIGGIVGLKNQVGKKFVGYEVIGTDEDLPKLAKSYEYALITIGQIKSPEKRIDADKLAKSLGFKMATVVSERSYVSSRTNIAEGTVVMHGAIVNSGVTIGANCIINSGALVEHNTKIGNYCHVSTGVVINGNVTVDDGVFIGSGTIVKQGLHIGSRAIIGMGSRILNNIPPAGYIF